MTESIYNNDISSEKDLNIPVVKVFFNDGDYVELHSAARYHYVDGRNPENDYDEFDLADGSTLVPIDRITPLVGDEVLIDLMKKLEPVPDALDGPYLRTRAAGENFRFLESVRGLASNFERLESQISLGETIDAERAADDLQAALRHEKELWLPFEAGPNADGHIAGKIIVARLALFMSESPYNGSPGIYPIVFNHDEGHFTPVPEQLRMMHSWLYVRTENDNE